GGCTVTGWKSGHHTADFLSPQNRPDSAFALVPRHPGVALCRIQVAAHAQHPDRICRLPFCVALLLCRVKARTTGLSNTGITRNRQHHACYRGCHRLSGFDHAVDIFRMAARRFSRHALGGCLYIRHGRTAQRHPWPLPIQGSADHKGKKHESVDRPASTSTGRRMEFYRNTLAQIQKNPLLGTVNGSFPVVYSQQAKDAGRVASKNPHNEFMLITVQTGFVGLAALLWLFWQQWRYAPQLPTPLERSLAQGLVMMMALICMLNSTLLDHTEGLLFAWLTALLYGGLESAHPVSDSAPTTST
ncbi:MAG: O-antigen ligase family protein, partial [Burkholderiales bacterium]